MEVDVLLGMSTSPAKKKQMLPRKARRNFRWLTSWLATKPRLSFRHVRVGAQTLRGCYIGYSVCSSAISSFMDREWDINPRAAMSLTSAPLVLVHNRFSKPSLPLPRLCAGLLCGRVRLFELLPNLTCFLVVIKDPLP